MSLMSSYAFGFMSPKMRQTIIDQERARDQRLYEQLVREKAQVPWEDTKIKFQKALLIDGNTYDPHRLWDVKPLPMSAKIEPQKAAYQRTIGRDYFYQHKIWKPGHPISIVSGKQRGKAFITKEVEIPMLIKACTNTWEIWMSITAMEVMTQRRGLQLATGTVLIGGLGLGWFLRRVCEKPSVKRVIVVEKDRDLLHDIREAMEERYPANLHKVTDWIEGDVYDHIGRHGADTRHLLDIWPAYGGTDSKFEKLKRDKAVKHLWGWGDVVNLPE